MFTKINNLFFSYKTDGPITGKVRRARKAKIKRERESERET